MYKISNMASDEDTRAVCSLCRRFFSLTAADLVHNHGPVVNRCSGSRQPPGIAVSVGPSQSLCIKSESTGMRQYCSACLWPFSSLFLSPSAGPALFSAFSNVRASFEDPEEDFYSLQRAGRYEVSRHFGVCGW